MIVDAVRVHFKEQGTVYFYHTGLLRKFADYTVHGTGGAQQTPHEASSAFADIFEAPIDTNIPSLTLTFFAGHLLFEFATLFSSHQLARSTTRPYVFSKED